MASPQVIVIAGPNGAGKSTAASLLLAARMMFVNADEIAKTLPGYPSTGVDRHAGRLALEQMDELERQRADFAVETTLAGRSLAPRLARLRRAGYLFHLIFIWSPSVAFSVQRVAARVRAGGHATPEETIRRRYEAGMKHFFRMDQPLADRWEVFENTQLEGFRMIAAGKGAEVVGIQDRELWDLMRRWGTDE